MRHLFLLMALTSVGWIHGQGARPTPPPEPPVKPEVAMPAEVDSNGTMVDDRIETAVLRARGILRNPNRGAAEETAAIETLQTTVSVELLFNKQISQNQIDAFLKAGGTIDKVYTRVSYGWTGSISRDAAMEIPAAMGAGFLGVVLESDAELHLDEATRTGRVRPQVWNLGVDGTQLGLNRITIAVVDTGVDGTHLDLAGRQVYWRDWTTDGRLNARDVGHHGSHVAGIVTGSGTSSPAGSTTINYTDIGSMSETAGSFFPSPIHIPLSVPTVNWTSTMRWNANGSTSARLGHVVGHPDSTWATLSSTVSTASPFSHTTTGYTNPPAGYVNRYSTYPTKTNEDTRTPAYAIANNVAYAGPPDGFPIFRGVAPDASWAGLKVFTDSGGGSSVDIGEAIDDLVQQNTTYQIKVANLSLGIVGTPGISTTLRTKLNNAAANGVVCVVSAGNSGEDSSGAAGEISDPARAHYGITVVATSDVNQLTGYSSHGFPAPGDSNGGDQDTKPDIAAPGGSTSFQSNIMSIDSNTLDSTDSDGFSIPDMVPNDYYNIQGTSMASPFVAGSAALIIDALQQRGETWDFTGGAALTDVLRVKMLLLLTATETNLPREKGPSGNPVLNRGAKDINEGYGLINPDAAVEAILNPVVTAVTGTATEVFGSAPADRRCWARQILLTAGVPVSLNLDVPAGADYDMYLYSGSPDTFGNPRIRNLAALAGAGVDEQLVHVPTSTEVGYLVVKRVSGAGEWRLSTPASVSAWSMY